MPRSPLLDISIRANAIHLPREKDDSALGRYYLDFTGVLPLVEQEYHGPVDARGVPMNRFAGQGDFHNVITIAQYALALHDTILASGETAELKQMLQAQLNTIVELIEPGGQWKGFFLHQWNSPKYPELRAPWVSALGQGNGISALLRGYQWNGDPRLLECATAMFEALERPMSEGGAREVDANGHFWLEEYPMKPSSHVLNGFIFALWGVLDFARVTGSPRAWEWWNAGCQTLRVRLKDYDCGFWSVYDLSHRELASQYYQLNIHIPQLEAMHWLTGDELYLRFARRWRQFSRRRWNRALWWIGLRVGARLRALKARRKGNA